MDEYESWREEEKLWREQEREMHAELQKLRRVRDAAEALRASHSELVASGWSVGSPEHCEWVKRDNAVFWNLCAALDAAKDES